MPTADLSRAELVEYVARQALLVAYSYRDDDRSEEWLTAELDRLQNLIDRPAPAPTPDAAALTAEQYQNMPPDQFLVEVELPLMIETGVVHHPESGWLKHVRDTLRSQAAEIERLKRTVDVSEQCEFIADAEYVAIKADRDRLRAELAAFRDLANCGGCGCMVCKGLRTAPPPEAAT